MSYACLCDHTETELHCILGSKTGSVIVNVLVTCLVRVVSVLDLCSTCHILVVPEAGGIACNAKAVCYHNAEALLTVGEGPGINGYGCSDSEVLGCGDLGVIECKTVGGCGLDLTLVALGVNSYLAILVEVTNVAVTACACGRTVICEAPCCIRLFCNKSGCLRGIHMLLATDSANKEAILFADSKTAYHIYKLCGLANELVATVDLILLCLAGLCVFKLNCTVTLACCARDIGSGKRKLIIYVIFCGCLGLLALSLNSSGYCVCTRPLGRDLAYVLVAICNGGSNVLAINVAALNGNGNLICVNAVRKLTNLSVSDDLKRATDIGCGLNNGCADLAPFNGSVHINELVLLNLYSENVVVAVGNTDEVCAGIVNVEGGDARIVLRESLTCCLENVSICIIKRHSAVVIATLYPPDLNGGATGNRETDTSYLFLRGDGSLCLEVNSVNLSACAIVSIGECLGAGIYLGFFCVVQSEVIICTNLIRLAVLLHT